MKLDIGTVIVHPRVGDYWVLHNPLSLVQITKVVTSPNRPDKEIGINVWGDDGIESWESNFLDSKNYSRLNWDDHIPRESVQVSGDFDFKAGDFWLLDNQILVVIPSPQDYIYFMGTERFDIRTGEIRPFQLTKNEVTKDTVLSMVSQSLEMAVGSTDITFDEVTEIWNELSIKEVLESK